MMIASNPRRGLRLPNTSGMIVPADGSPPEFMSSQPAMRPAGMMFRGFGGSDAMSPPGGQQIVAGDAPPMDLGDFTPPPADPGSLFTDPSARSTPLDAMNLSREIAGAQVSKPGFFSKNGAGLDILGGLSDGILQMSGMNPVYGPAQQRRRSEQTQLNQQHAEWARQEMQRQQDRQWQAEDRDVKLKTPQYFMAGHDRVAFDPSTGQSKVVYDAPEDYQAYASSLGLNPGDDGYDKAVQDYVLRSSGPTALSGKINLEGTRQGNRLQLRSTPTYQQTHPAPSRARTGGGAPRAPTSLGGVVAPILAKIAQGQTLSPGEQNALSTYQAGRGGHGRGGRTAAGGGGGAVLPTVRTPAEARALPAGTRFKTPDGREMVR